MPTSSKGWIGTFISFSYFSMLFYLKVIHQSFVQIWKLTCCHELIKQFKSLFIKLKLLHKIIYHPGFRSNQKGQNQKFLLWISLLNELWFFFPFQAKKERKKIIFDVRFCFVKEKVCIFGWAVFLVLISANWPFDR